MFIVLMSTCWQPYNRSTSDDIIKSRRSWCDQSVWVRIVSVRVQHDPESHILLYAECWLWATQWVDECPGRTICCTLTHVNQHLLKLNYISAQKARLHR